MALLPQDRRGQTELVLTIFAAAFVYFVWAGTPIGGVPGLGQLAKSRDSLQGQIESLKVQVQNAQRVVARGELAQLDRRLAEYRASLDLMRQLVPAGEEIPNLLDDITSRAKMRGAVVADWKPAAALESGSPFDTQRARWKVTGQYDQIGEFLADIASLPRIVVPYDVKIERAQLPAGDTTHNRTGTMLVAELQIRTYVKPQPSDTAGRGRRPAAPRPGAPAAGRAR